MNLHAWIVADWLTSNGRDTDNDWYGIYVWLRLSECVWTLINKVRNAVCLLWLLWYAWWNKIDSNYPVYGMFRFFFWYPWIKNNFFSTARKLVYVDKCWCIFNSLVLLERAACCRKIQLTWLPWQDSMCDERNRGVLTIGEDIFDERAMLSNILFINMNPI